MRALNIATLMDMKWMVLRKLRQRAGIELVRARKNPNLSDFIDNRRINLVLDVGANTGQFGQLLRRRGYAGQIISFEPVKEAFWGARKRGARRRSVDDLEFSPRAVERGHGDQCFQELSVQFIQ